MNNAKEFIQKICYRLKVGQSIIFDRRMFLDAFPCGYPSIYQTPKEAFLSSMIGSSWGAFTIGNNGETGDFIVSRNNESNKRVYVDPDRKHLFKTMPDGTLELRQRECDLT